ncbi:MAG: trimethylamine methyltransferase family protein [Spirochaetes bacterium]|nr:trimethylamine methyltransferase family protein [Spirochaetota bacterium]
MKVTGNFLSKAEMEKIHTMSLRVLANVGVSFDDEHALETFRKHGARVENDVVYIDEALLNKALSTVPFTFDIYGRNKTKVVVGGGHQVIAPASGPLYVLNGEDIHRNTAEDYKNFQKLHHNSPVMDMLNPNLIEPSDISREVVRNYQMAVCLKYTEKPLLGLTTSPQDAVNSIEMTQRFYGFTSNVLLGIVNVISPLKYDKTMLEALRLCVERDQPVMVACCSLPGATSPATLSGTIVVNNAEVLAGIVYAQLLRPGVGVLYGNTSGNCDMRYVNISIGAPETSLFIFAAAAMAEYYKIPCRTGGALSDSKTVDWQAGVESSITMLPSLMSGSHFILHACGVMDSFNIISYEKYLLDEQNIQMLRRITQGTEILDNEEEFANILEVGTGGQYLQSGHTMEHFQDQLYNPLLFNKMAYEVWEQKGCPSAVEAAGKAVKKRLEDYSFPEMLPDQEKVLESYIGELIRTI